MGIFDKLFPSGSLKPEEPSGAERRLRERLAVASGDPATAATPLRFHLRWTGQVQGVGFRFNNTNLARARNLTGWVQNMPDGSVEMEVQGAPANILSHLEALHDGYRRMGTRFRLAEGIPLAIDPFEETFEPRY